MDKKKKSVLKKKLAILNYLLHNHCIDCGETDISTLQFDHLSDKTKKVSSLVRANFSLKEIFKEISKCEIRCANCHAKKTAKDFDWYKEFFYCKEEDVIKIKDEYNEESWRYR